MAALTKRQITELTETPVPDSRNRLALAIEMAGLTQVALGRELGMSNTYVSDTARGRQATLTLENARKFAEFFGVPVEVLFPARIEAA